MCVLEVEGLRRKRQVLALELELSFEESLVEVLEQCTVSRVFQCKTPKLLASQVTAQLEQWHLKQWKFKLRGVSNDDYAQFIFDNLMRCLHCASA